MTFSFDEKDPLERARAERVVTDMLARGYLLFASVEGAMVRVLEFDAKRAEYTIADGPGTPVSVDTPAEAATEVKRGRGRPRRVPAKGTPVTGVAPTSGG